MTDAAPFRHLYIARASAIAVPALAAALVLAQAPPQCPVARHFHVPCPGCGLTRATRFLLAGDLSASWHLQPLLVPLLLVLASLFVGVVVGTLLRGFPGAMVDTRAGRVVLGFAIAVTALDLALWLARFAGGFGGPVPV